MAIAYSTGSSGYLGTTASSQTVAFNSGSSGSNRILIVFVTSLDGKLDAGSLTYGGTAMTKIVKQDYGGGVSDDFSCYYLINPATGSNNLVFTFSGGNDRVMYSALVYTGAEQANQPDNYGNASFTTDTTISASLSSVDNNCMFVYGVSNYAADLTADTNVTARTENNDNGSMLVGDYGPVTPASNITQTIISVSGQKGAKIQITLSPAASASGPINVKTYNGLAAASVKTINGLAIASVKTWNGLT